MNILVIMMLPAIALVMVVHTLIFQPYDVPTTSMAPTLNEGESFVLSKYAYGYSRFSFPFPVAFSGRVLGSKPAYGDIVVFRVPKDTSTEYIKRVVGLPGDRIQMKNGGLHINGKAVERRLVLAGDLCERGSPAAKRWTETLPNGVSHDILDCVENGYYDNTQEYVVPAGHYFMMGDNRDNSADSRVLNQVGYVPFENLVGRFAFAYTLGADADDDDE